MELDHLAQVEEEFVYPDTKAQGGDHEELTLEAREEHNVAKTLIEEIKTMAPDDETFAAKMTVLKEAGEPPG